MNIFLRTFNNKINSKTGAPLPDGQYRGTPEWLRFFAILSDCLKDCGHKVIAQLESPLYPDDPRFSDFDKRIYVHQTKRERPEGDLFWMQMHMRELFTIDTQGWGANHSENNFQLGDVDAEEAKAFCEAKSRELLETGLSKCDQPKECSPTPESFILVPVQTPRDYVLKHHSPITVRYFLDSLMSWAEETQTHICIKMHPHNKSDYDLHQTVDQGAASEFVHKVEGNIHELIKRSSGLFVINSGTGFESLVHGKQVATFGSCDYSKATFNADIRRLDEAREFLYDYSEEFRSIAYQFVYWYWTKHAYDVNREDTKERLITYLKGVL